jgi:hypothetical protein
MLGRRSVVVPDFSSTMRSRQTVLAHNTAARWILVPVLTALLAAATLAAAPPDLTGAWMGLIPGVGRRPAQYIEFRIEQDGSKLSGKLYGEAQSSAIISGEVDPQGNVYFVVEAREQAGNQINIVEYRFDGVLCGTGIDLTRERAALRDAISGVPAPVRRPDDTDEEDRQRRFRSFRLERLF